MSSFQPQPARTRFAALGLAAMTTLGLLTGMATLAESQVADADFVAAMHGEARAAAPVEVQRVVVVGKRAAPTQKVVVTSQRAPRS